MAANLPVVLEAVRLGRMVDQWLVSRNDASFFPFTIEDLDEFIAGAPLYVWDENDRSSKATLLFERPKPTLSVISAPRPEGRGLLEQRR